MARLVEFLRSIGKRPAVVGDGPGFVANRIQNALFLGAVRCVEEGLASPQEVDEVVRSCFGFRLPFFGPFQISDMAGLDVYENVLDVLKDGLGERFEAPNPYETSSGGDARVPRAARAFFSTPKKSGNGCSWNATGATRP